jgi:hypothetical protein
MNDDSLNANANGRRVSLNCPAVADENEPTTTEVPANTAGRLVNLLITITHPLAIEAFVQNTGLLLPHTRAGPLIATPSHRKLNCQ